MSKIKCSSCGKEIDSTSDFCYYCGNDVNKKPGLLTKFINLFKSNNNSKLFYDRFLVIKEELAKFNKEIADCDYFDNSLKKKLKKENKNNYSTCLNLKEYYDDEELKLKSDELDLIKLFIENYKNFDKIAEATNKKHIDIFYNKFKFKKGRCQSVVDKYNRNISYDEFITSDKEDLKDDYEFINNLMNFEKSDKYDFGDDFELMREFCDIYKNFDKIKNEINEGCLQYRYNLFSDKKMEIDSHITQYQNLTVDVFLANKKQFFDNYSPIYNALIDLKNNNYHFNKSDLLIVDNFFELFENFKVEFPKNIYKKYSNYKSLITKFLNKYGNGVSQEYIFNKEPILKTYSNTYGKVLDVVKLNKAQELDLSDEELNKINKFINLYDDFDSYVEKNNKCYVKRICKEYSNNKPEILKFVSEYNKCNVLNFYIDNEKKLKILKSNEKYYDLIQLINRIPEAPNDVATDFIDVYDNFDDIIFHMNKNYVEKLYDSIEEKIEEYVVIANLKQNYYISGSRLKQLLSKYDDYLDTVSDLMKYCFQYDYLSDMTKLIQFPKSSNKLISIVPEANESFIERELKENKELLDTVVPGKPLDINQRRAAVIDEDNTQIIAGAGCGKTLTLQAKAKYLIEKQNINPSEILAISFSKFSAEDLKYKMNQIGLNVDVSTFHALGLDILRKNYVNAKVDEFALDKSIKSYFLSNIINNENMIQKIIEYFGYYMYEPLDKNQIDKIGEVYDYEWGMDLETLYSKFEKLKDPSLKKTSLKGEKVKSLEERKIANFLFINGVNYTYEKAYEPKIDWEKTRDYLCNSLFNGIELPKNIKKELINQVLEYLELDEFMYWPLNKKRVKSYNPDFYLDDNDIYYEHFGVNRQCLAPWLPNKKSKEYNRSLRNKRLLHKKYGTALIETYSYYQSENRLLDRLRDKLIENGVQFKKIDYKQYMIDLLQDEEKISEYWDFIKLVKTFINLFKGNGYTKEKFDEFRKINETESDDFRKEKHELFLEIIEDIYDYYYNYLEENGLIDFNDMINDAVEKVKINGYYKNYKYILVDEFQDTSHTRFNLLKSLKEDLNAKLIVVGDDWQSIYRFAGCDIDLFTNFENYFSDSKTEKCYITNTYRNSQSLIDVSGNFIMKNEAQFKKQLNSKSKNQIKDTIKLYQYLEYSEQPLVFESILQDISHLSDNKEANILVLGRNNMDYLNLIHEDLFYTSGSLEDKNLKIHYRKNPKISIDYKTVHGSKGLEEDNVILVNLENKKNGFPNKIEDDSVLSFVKNDIVEPIEFAEERRLFYVALTRTLKRTYLLAPKDKKSVFVNEIMEDVDVIDFVRPENDEVDDGDEIRTIESTDEVCPACGTGKINLLYNPKTGKKFFKCSNWPRCDWFGGNFIETVDELKNPRRCPKCGGLLIKRMSKKGNLFYGCINFFYDNCRYGERINDNNV